MQPGAVGISWPAQRSTSGGPRWWRVAGQVCDVGRGRVCCDLEEIAPHSAGRYRICYMVSSLPRLRRVPLRIPHYASSTGRASSDPELSFIVILVPPRVKHMPLNGWTASPARRHVRNSGNDQQQAASVCFALGSPSASSPRHWAPTPPYVVVVVVVAAVSPPQ